MATTITSPPFGSDSSCTTQIWFGRMVTGQQLIQEAMLRRLSTPRGSLRDVADPVGAANYGLDLCGLLNTEIVGSGSIAAKESMIAAECRKDQRISSATATITAVGTNAYRLDLDLDTTDGQVSLALSVDDVTVALLEDD